MPVYYHSTITKRTCKMEDASFAAFDRIRYYMPRVKHTFTDEWYTITDIDAFDVTLVEATKIYNNQRNVGEPLLIREGTDVNEQHNTPDAETSYEGVRFEAKKPRKVGRRRSPRRHSSTLPQGAYTDLPSGDEEDSDGDVTMAAGTNTRGKKVTPALENTQDQFAVEHVASLLKQCENDTQVIDAAIAGIEGVCMQAQSSQSSDVSARFQSITSYISLIKESNGKMKDIIDQNTKKDKENPLDVESFMKRKMEEALQPSKPPPPSRVDANGSPMPRTPGTVLGKHENDDQSVFSQRPAKFQIVGDLSSDAPTMALLMGWKSCAHDLAHDLSRPVKFSTGMLSDSWLTSAVAEKFSLHAVSWNGWIAVGPKAFIRALQIFIRDEVATHPVYKYIGIGFLKQILQDANFPHFRISPRPTPSSPEAAHNGEADSSSSLDVDNPPASIQGILSKKHMEQAEGYWKRNITKLRRGTATIMTITDLIHKAGGIEQWHEITNDAVDQGLNQWRISSMVTKLGISSGDLPDLAIPVRQPDDEWQDDGQ